MGTHPEEWIPSFALGLSPPSYGVSDEEGSGRVRGTYEVFPMREEMDVRRLESCFDKLYVTETNIEGIIYLLARRKHPAAESSTHTTNLSDSIIVVRGGEDYARRMSMPVS